MIAAEAARWVGYLEHETPARLEVFRANAGKGGHTIFERILRQKTGAELGGVPWCVTFVYACALDALGREATETLLGGPMSGLKTLKRNLKRRGRWRGRGYVPQRNDLVFFRCGGHALGHVGIVETVTGDTIRCIDGNTADPSGCFQPKEGGAVARRRRALTDRRIVGYGQLDVPPKKQSFKEEKTW